VSLLAGVIAIESLIVGLNPETFLRVDIKPVDTALDAPLREDGGWVTVHLLGYRVEHTVVHALLKPQLTIAVFPYLVDIVIAQSGGIARVRVICAEAISIVPVKTIRSAYPYESARVLEHVVYLRVRQTIACIKPTELHVGDYRSCSARRQAGHTDYRGKQLLNIHI
jgi:hypothetical protein